MLRRFKGSRSLKGFKRQRSELPRGRETDAGIAAFIPAVADAQTAAVEVADAYPETVRDFISTSDVAVFKHTLSAQEEMDDHPHYDNSGRWHFLSLGKQSLLLAEVLI